jgi:hypothetical protein
MNVRAHRFCATRAQKNIRWLCRHAPEVFLGDEPRTGWESRIPNNVLAQLHRSIPRRFDGPLDLERLRQITFPRVESALKEPLFNGTIHFVQVRFTIQSPPNRVSVSATDVQTAVSYATTAAPQIVAYAGQYGPTAIKVSQSVLTYDVTLASNTYTDTDLQGWVNAIRANHSLPDSACIAILNPPGVINTAADPSQGVLGYHGKSEVPYVFVNVFGSGLTIGDANDDYAEALSHEIAEMAVDPAADLVNPEVCDPCAGNCNNLYLAFFNASGAYLGSAQTLPPGFAYSFFTSTVAKPSAAASCPAPKADCAYEPP